MTLLISHIPKTAGTSLRTLVARFHADAVFAYRRELALGKPDIEFVKAFRAQAKPAVVIGHFSYSVHRLLGVPPRYATVLRDPVERVVSLYRHHRARADSPFAAHFRAGMTLRTFVSAAITEETNNHMCRCIAGVAPDAGPVINDRWLLDLALHNLRRDYVMIGFVEKFAELLGGLAQQLAWGPFEMPWENLGCGPPIELDEPTRAAIVDKNSLDIALYEYTAGQHA
jgi:hypothetical protein